MKNTALFVFAIILIATPVFGEDSCIKLMEKFFEVENNKKVQEVL